MFVDIPVTVQRSVDETNYLVTAHVEPVSDFSAQVRPMVELSESFVRGLAAWGAEGESLRAIFEFAGQTVMGESGHGVISVIATFEWPETNTP